MPASKYLDPLISGEKMTVPIYDPPYDSYIEDKFAYNFVKYAAQDCSLSKQYLVKTICGNFIVDFLVVASNGTRIGIECDGKDFHNPSRDEWRDAMILGDGYLDIMYRISGDDINYQIANVLYLMANIDPYIFMERALVNLKILASKGTEQSSENLNCNSPSIIVKIEDSENFHRVLLERRNNDGHSGSRQFWKTAYKYADQIGGGNLDEIINKYRNNV